MITLAEKLPLRLCSVVSRDPSVLTIITLTLPLC
jgi:hypothetical protein